MRYWHTLRSDADAHFDHEIRLDAAKLPQIVTWGTSPEDVVSISGVVPDPDQIATSQAVSKHRALEYMGLTPDADHRHQARSRLHRLLHQRPHRGPAGGRESRRGQDRQRSCQRDGRAGLGPREGAGRSRRPRQDLQRRGLRVARAGLFDVPGDERRQACAGERCASTCNRNFEGRQGLRAARIWFRRRWRRLRRSPAISSTSASGVNVPVA